MKKHWQAEHPTKYTAIRSWLGDSDAKIRIAEILAKEGMKGAGQDAEMPKIPIRRQRRAEWD